MIFILDKKEKVINTLKNNYSGNNGNPYFNDVLQQDLATGAESYSFSTFANGTIANDLVIGNYIAFKHKNSYKLFQITNVEVVHEESMEISVYSECAGLTLLNNVFRSRKMTSCTLRQFIDAVVENTDWATGLIEEAVNSVDLDIETTSCYSALQQNISSFGVELEFRVELNRGKVSKKYIDTYKQRGRVTGKRFTYGRDIEKVVKTVNSEQLYTALIGEGRNGVTFRDITVDGIDKPLGQDFVADQESFQKYNRNGYHLMGVYSVDSESPEIILRETYKKLQEVKSPKISYEIPVVMLGELLGLKWDEVSIGDQIGILDAEFNPPLMLSARVSNLQISKSNPESSTCTLSNFIEVSSNITDEMRKIASKLEGYVDNKFPIGSNDIQEGAVNGTHMDKQYMTQITADIVNTTTLNAKEIIAEEITAVNGRFENIEADVVKANQIAADAIKANTITAGKVDAVEGNFTQLNATVGEITTLVNGNLTSENIQAGGITGDNLNMNTVFVDNANIISVNANKINAGEINTNKVHIQSENGGIVIADNTQQFKDKNGKVRVQIGQDAKGDFNFGVFDETGTGVLIDATGVKEKALADGIIKDRMIGQGEIGGNKIDINSLITEVNKDTNTTAIKGSKVLLDTEGQKLDVAFNSLKTTVNNIEIGGRNLALSTSFEKIDGNISEMGTRPFTTVPFINKKDYSGVSNSIEWKVSGATENKWLGLGINTSIDNTKLSKGKVYTISFWYYVFSDTVCDSFSVCLKNHTLNKAQLVKSLDISVKDKWVRCVYSGVVSEDVNLLNKTLYVYLLKNGHVKIAQVKLEEGNKSTAWTPAPEDIESKVESNTTAISVAQGEIKTLIQDTTIEKDGQSLKLKDEYSKLEQTVSGFSTTIGQQNTTITEIGKKVDNAESVANSANSKVDEIQIGGRNLILNGSFLSNTTNWAPENLTVSVIDDSIYKKALKISNPSGQRIYQGVNNIWKKGQIYTMSFYAKSSVAGGMISPSRSLIDYGATQKLTTEWKRYFCTITSTESPSGGTLSLSFSNASEIYITKIKLEEGNKATDWTPAPEDIDSAISDVASDVSTLTGKVTTVENKYSTLNQDLNSFKTTVGNTYSTKTELSGVDGKVNSLTNRVSTTESSITQLNNKIALKVEATDVSEAINNVQIGGRNYALSSKYLKIIPPGKDNWDQPFNISESFWQNSNRNKPNNIKISFTIYAETARPTDFNGRMYFRSSPWHSSPFTYPKNTTEKKYIELSYSITDPAYYTNQLFIRFMAADTSNYPFIIENLKLEVGNKATDWIPAPEDVENDATNKANAAQNAAKNYTDGQITTVNKTITDKVAEIKLTTDSITQKVSSTESSLTTKINTAQSTANTANSTANANKTEISSTKSKVATIETNLNSITQRVSSTESTLTSTTSTANSALANANSANAKIDGLEVGGRNLIRTSYIINKGCTTFTYDKTNNTWTCVAPTGSNSWGYGFTISSGGKIPVERGKTFIISLEVNPSINCSWNADVNNSYTGNTAGGNDNDDTSKRQNSSKTLKANVWTKCWFSYTAKDNVSYDLYDSSSNWGIITTSLSSAVSFKIRNIKGEYGNKPTDWTPAPEDVDSTIESAKNSAISTASSDATNKANSALSSAKDYTNGQITTVNKTITDKVAEIKATTDSITSRVSSTETKTTNLENTVLKKIINNFSISGNLKLWDAPSTSIVSSSAVGNYANVTTSGNILVVSDYAEIDPTKTYKVSLMVQNPSASGTGSWYFGIYAYDKNKSNIGAYVNTGTTLNTNPYFHSEVKSNQNTSWRTFESYIYAHNTAVNSNTPKGNCGSFMKFSANTKYIRIRFLNYRSASDYGNGASGSIYFAHPTIAEVDNRMVDTETRLKSAEQKITAEAILNSVNTQIGNGGQINTVSTILDKNGFTVNNGAITIRNKAGSTVLTGDANGNLSLTGTININTQNSQQLYVNTNDSKRPVLVSQSKGTFTRSLAVSHEYTAWSEDKAYSGVTITPNEILTPGLRLNGALIYNGNNILNGTDSWLRTYGATGWYNGTYGGGWYMQDNTWIRSHSSKNVYVDKMVRADTGFQVGDSGMFLNISAAGEIGCGAIWSRAGISAVAESKFSVGAYTDPLVGVACAIKATGRIAANYMHAEQYRFRTTNCSINSRSSGGFDFWISDNGNRICFDGTIIYRVTSSGAWTKIAG